MIQKFILNETDITGKILLIRGKKVMLDRDLASLYDVETKYLKRQVTRNSLRFPEDFMFILSKAEVEILRCQNGTSSWGGSRYLPMAFCTEIFSKDDSKIHSQRS